MKKTLVLIQGMVLASLWAADPQYSVLEQGGHHRLLYRLQETVWPDGVHTQDPHYLVALETGMNHWENNAWVPSQEIFEVVQGGAAAVHGQHKAWIAENLNTLGGSVLPSQWCRG